MAGFQLCPAAPLEAFSCRVFEALGAPRDIAGEVAGHLVRANLSGHDSHGVQRVVWYVDQADRDQLVPEARPRVVRDHGTTALMDAQHGFGHYSTAVALAWAIDRAREQGLAAAAVRNSTHIGRLGEYTERAAGQGLIAIVTVGGTTPGAGLVVPHGGQERLLGTNPWSFGVPATGHDPFIFDAATSMIAEGKVRFALSKGVELPKGCIVDKEGRASTNPADLYAGGALLPLGGPVAGHKGYSLALASALLGGLSMSDDLADGAEPTGRLGGVFLVVIDPAWFGDGEGYRAQVGAALAAAERTAPAAGVPEVLAPGIPEARSREARGREGIAVPEATWQDLARVGERFSVPLPDHREV